MEQECDKVRAGCDPLHTGVSITSRTCMLRKSVDDVTKW